MEDWFNSRLIKSDTEEIADATSLSDPLFYFWTQQYKKPFKKSRGFCLNDRCRGGEIGFLVESHKRKKNMYMSSNHSNVDCPYCRSMLYWSNDWEEI